MSVVILI